MVNTTLLAYNRWLVIILGLRVLAAHACPWVEACLLCILTLPLQRVGCVCLLEQRLGGKMPIQQRTDKGGFHWDFTSHSLSQRYLMAVLDQQKLEEEEKWWSQITFPGKGPVCSHLLVSAVFPCALEFKLLFISFCGFSLWKDLLFCISWKKKIKTSEASLGILQSGSRKLCFSVEANERSSCNRWDIRLYVCRGKGWRKKQAVCLLLLSVTRNISTLPSDREGLQPGTCNTASKKALLPIQVKCIWFSQSHLATG